MSTNKVLAAIAATSVLALFSFAPAYAESIPQQQIDQFGNKAAPDVDPGASKGPDASIVEQEQRQVGNEPARDLDPAKSVSKGGESLPSMEKDGLKN
jgi:hypothetical protein